MQRQNHLYDLNQSVISYYSPRIDKFKQYDCKKNCQNFPYLNEYKYSVSIKAIIHI